MPRSSARVLISEAASRRQALTHSRFSGVARNRGMDTLNAANTFLRCRSGTATQHRCGVDSSSSQAIPSSRTRLSCSRSGSRSVIVCSVSRGIPWEKYLRTASSSRPLNRAFPSAVALAGRRLPRREIMRMAWSESAFPM